MKPSQRLSVLAAVVGVSAANAGKHPSFSPDLDYPDRGHIQKNPSLRPTRNQYDRPSCCISALNFSFKLRHSSTTSRVASKLSANGPLRAAMGSDHEWARTIPNGR